MRNQLKEYRKKSVGIKAIQWDGSVESASLISQWVSDVGGRINAVFFEVQDAQVTEFHIKTLEGGIHIDSGEFVCKGDEGDFFLCRPGYFKETHEEYDSETGEWVDVEF